MSVVVVSNFSRLVKKNDLVALLEMRGRVVYCEFRKEFAFMHVSSRDVANVTVKELDGHFFKGTKIKVEQVNRGPGDCYFYQMKGHCRDSLECPWLHRPLDLPRNTCLNHLLRRCLVRDCRQEHLDRATYLPHAPQQELNRLNRVERKGEQINRSMSVGLVGRKRQASEEFPTEDSSSKSSRGSTIVEELVSLPTDFPKLLTDSSTSLEAMEKVKSQCPGAEFKILPGRNKNNEKDVVFSASSLEQVEDFKKEIYQMMKTEHGIDFNELRRNANDQKVCDLQNECKELKSKYHLMKTNFNLREAELSKVKYDISHFKNESNSNVKTLEEELVRLRSVNTELQAELKNCNEANTEYLTVHEKYRHSKMEIEKLAKKLKRGEVEFSKLKSGLRHSKENDLNVYALARELEDRKKDTAQTLNINTDLRENIAELVRVGDQKDKLIASLQITIKEKEKVENLTANEHVNMLKKELEKLKAWLKLKDDDLKQKQREIDFLKSQDHSLGNEEDDTSILEDV